MVNLLNLKKRKQKSLFFFHYVFFKRANLNRLRWTAHAATAVQQVQAGGPSTVTVNLQLPAGSVSGGTAPYTRPEATNIYSAEKNKQKVW